MMVNESRQSRAHFDKTLVIMVFIMAAFGVLSVSVASFSTSSTPEDTIFNYIVTSHYGMRQAIFLLISPVIIGVITYFPYEVIRRRSTMFYYMACGLLAVTLITNQAQGVKAWTDIIWGYTIQPSEFVKLACIIAVAKHLETETDPLSNMHSWFRLGFLMGMPALLTLAQGEMGSVLVMAVIFVAMMFFGGMRWRLIVTFMAIFAILLVVLFVSLRLAFPTVAVSILFCIGAFGGISLVHAHAGYDPEKHTTRFDRNHTR